MFYKFMLRAFLLLFQESLLQFCPQKKSIKKKLNQSEQKYLLNVEGRRANKKKSKNLLKKTFVHKIIKRNMKSVGKEVHKREKYVFLTDLLYMHKTHPNRISHRNSLPICTLLCYLSLSERCYYTLA